MLKKLVKYGNSNALVLDKALLELLNIEEGSLVKIRTDGNSLIITPQNANSNAHVSGSVIPQESLQEAMQQNLIKKSANPQAAHAYFTEMNAVGQRYQKGMKKLDAPAAKQKLAQLEEEFNGNRFDPEFLKAFIAVRNQYAPELAQLDTEVKELSEKYASVEQSFSDKEAFNYTDAIEDFKKIHQKYRPLLLEIAKLNENPDYIHDSVLLAEKYQATKNSPEYVQEYTQLIYKYVPEYKTYVDELTKLSEAFTQKKDSTK